VLFEQFATLFQSLKGASAGSQVLIPCIRQDQAFRAPIDKQQPNVALKTSQRPADCGSWNAQFLCGCAQSSRLDNGDKRANVIEIMLDHSESVSIEFESERATIEATFVSIYVIKSRIATR
jgi:hypothetical protein